jgi:type I restriction enzyme M protein
MRSATEVFRPFTYDELIARDKLNLDIQWQHAAESGAKAETPQALMKEILKDLEEAMKHFAAVESTIDE